MDHAKGKAALFLAADLLDRLGVPFFLMQGTALGAVRDGGFVPTEKDIDLGILQEDFGPAVYALQRGLHKRGCDTEIFVRPFTRPRTLVAWMDGAKVDFVGLARWKSWRFTATPVRPWVAEPYALVHEAALLETYQEVEMFGRRWRVPSPVEEYLLREYGEGWHTPKNDHMSRTRVYDFLAKEKVPCGLLES